MLSDAPSIGPGGSEDHPGRDSPWRPAASRNDLRREPATSIHRAEQIADVDQLRLELDDQQGAVFRVPQDQVDHAPLTPDRERDLVGHHPRWEVVGERLRHRLMQSGMPSAEDPIELGTASAWQELEPDLKRRRNLPEDTECHLGKLASLDPRDRHLGYAGADRQIELAPAAPQPCRPDRGTKPQILHDRDGGDGPLSATYSPPDC